MVKTEKIQKDDEPVMYWQVWECWNDGGSDSPVDPIRCKEKNLKKTLIRRFGPEEECELEFTWGPMNECHASLTTRSGKEVARAMSRYYC